MSKKKTAEIVDTVTIRLKRNGYTETMPISKWERIIALKGAKFAKLYEVTEHRIPKPQAPEEATILNEKTSNK